MADYKIPKKFTKIHDVFQKASVTDATLSNNPAYYVPQVRLATRGQLVYIYEDNGCLITATDTQVTTSRADGVITVNVPRETYLFSVRVIGSSVDVAADNTVKIKLAYAYSGAENQVLVGMEPIGITVWDYTLVEAVGEGPSDTYFASKVDKIWHCTLAQEGVDTTTELEVRVEDMNMDNWKINIGF